MLLQDICAAIVDCEHKTAPTTSSGHPSIRTPNIGPGYFILDGVNRVSPDTYGAWTKRMRPRPGDLIMAREAPVGNVAMIPDGLEPCLGQRTLLIRPEPAIIDSRYLVFLLISPVVQGQIHGKTNGATVAHLNMADVRRLELPQLPGLFEQRRIASILSAYDDLIENNRKRIAILEDMARRLYREWFVHFRYPGRESVPLVDSPLGLIPQGWEAKRIDDICTAVLDGDWIETKDQGGSDYRLLQISNIGLGDFVETGNFRYVSEETFRRLRCTEIKPDDLLVARMPTPIGRAWLAKKMQWRMITAVDVAILRANSNAVDPVFLVHFWNQPSTLALIEKQSSGTTRLRITRRELCALMAPVPLLSVQSMFAARVRPMMDLANNLRDQCEVLRRTRDLLLPRLMSGTLSVDALATAEAAAP